ncbi:ACT domain-containing protein [Candidatus Auribacterota bacterium]
MNKIFIAAADRPGVLAEVTEILAEKNINIENIDLEKLGTIEGISGCIIAVDNYELALRLLNNAAIAGAPFKAIPEENLVLLLDDAPGSLAKITKRFTENAININSIHIIVRGQKHMLAGISVDHLEEAKKAFKDILVFPR